MQFRQQIAQRGGFFAFTHAQYGVVRGLHLIVRDDDDANVALAGFNRADCGTFFVKQVRSDRYRNDRVDFFGVLFQRFFFNQAQDRERQRFVVTHGTGAATAWAHVVAGFAQRRAQTLAGHLQ